MISQLELEQVMIERHSKEIFETFKNAKVAIAGLGGLGSNIAIALARSGIGELLLVDFDSVEPSNLNRQAYFIEDLGKTKVIALRELLTKVNPYNQYIGICEKVTVENAVSLFSGYDVVVEAFDNPDNKAVLINELLTKTNIPVVSASGISGLYNPNAIVSKKVMNNLYVVGDGVNEVKGFNGLMAPRVMLAVGHQATLTCQILLNKVDIGGESV